MHFNPWTASPAEALAAHQAHEREGGEPDPLMLHRVAQEVLAARGDCLSASGGPAILLCLRKCLVHGLTPPRWLADAFIRRHALVTEAEVGSLDDAFGPLWPPHTRLATERRHQYLKRAVHAAVWQRLAEDPSQAVNRDLFEQIGEMTSICASGSLTERLYLEALAEGMPNALLARRTPIPRSGLQSVGREFTCGTAKSLHEH